MHKVRNAAFGLVALAIALGVAAPAGAETIRFAEGGQPIASGHLEGESHGVIHCPAAAEFFGGAPKGSAPGVVVINPVGTHLGGPKGGICEEIAKEFGG